MNKMLPLNQYTGSDENVVALYPAGSRPGQAIGIVVPCYNEAARLDLDAFEVFLASYHNVHFVFVNDGSKDATLEVLRRLQGLHPDRVEILSLSRNSGKAEAVRQGLLHIVKGQADFVGYWDADLATPLEIIEDFARLGQRYGEVDVIYGARLQLQGHRVARTLGRRIISRICARLARIAVGLPIGDTQCGAKLLRNTPELAKVVASPFSAGWLFDVELFSRLSAAKPDPASFYEYPLPEWTEVAGSKVTGRAIRRAGWAMLRLIAERRLGLRPAKVAIEVPEAHLITAETPAYDVAA